LRENLHQSNPPIKIVVTPKIRLRPNLRVDGDRVAVTEGVPVGGGVMDGLGDDVSVVGLGVCVAVGVAGGATRRSNFCSGRMTEVLFIPFQAIRSTSGTSYRSAIHESVSPLWTVW
jgi:hypothetical protein